MVPTIAPQSTMAERQERPLLHDALIAISEGVDLPGCVAADGRITTVVGVAPDATGGESP